MVSYHNVAYRRVLTCRKIAILGMVCSSMARRKSYNSKSKILSDHDFEKEHESLKKLPDVVVYTGNPQHKKNPEDYDLTPPASPRQDKTLCDGVGRIKKQQALDLLKEGLKHGMISEQFRGKFPQKVWAVSENEIAFEAQLENKDQGEYHGYPMGADPFASEVLRRWQQKTAK